MNRSFLRSAVLGAAAILALSACGGGGGGNTSEPAGAVAAAMDAAESGGLTKLVDYSCAAKKDDIAALFGGGDLNSLSALGVDPATMLQAIKMDFQDVKTTETSRSGDKATVHVTGNIAISFDEGKMKEVVKQILTSQGQPADDAAVAAMYTAMSSGLGQTQALDDDIAVVQENGKWLICE